MLDSDTSPAAAACLPPSVAADLLLHLLASSDDLDRLQRLIDDACLSLMAQFDATMQLIERAAVDHPQAVADLGRARAALAGAVTALQFQDLATQLIAHTRRALRSRADRLADGGSGAGIARPETPRPNPVTQDEMDAGSIELF